MVWKFATRDVRRRIVLNPSQSGQGSGSGGRGERKWRYAEPVRLHRTFCRGGWPVALTAKQTANPHMRSPCSGNGGERKRCPHRAHNPQHRDHSWNCRNQTHGKGRKATPQRQPGSTPSPLARVMQIAAPGTGPLPPPWGRARERGGFRSAAWCHNRLNTTANEIDDPAVRRRAAAKSPRDWPSLPLSLPSPTRGEGKNSPSARS